MMNREAWRLRFMWSQRVGQDWATELNWTELNSRLYITAERRRCNLWSLPIKLYKLNLKTNLLFCKSGRINFRMLLLLSHQSYLTLCDPIDSSPPGSRPWDSPGKNTGLGCHFLLHCMKVKSENEVAQSCPTLCDPMDCSLPGSSIHGISQARVLEWVAIAFSKLQNTSWLKIKLIEWISM